MKYNFGAYADGIEWKLYELLAPYIGEGEKHKEFIAKLAFALHGEITPDQFREACMQASLSLTREAQEELPTAWERKILEGLCNNQAFIRRVHVLNADFLSLDRQGWIAFLFWPTGFEIVALTIYGLILLSFGAALAAQFIGDSAIQAAYWLAPRLFAVLFVLALIYVAYMFLSMLLEVLSALMAVVREGWDAALEWRRTKHIAGGPQREAARQLRVAKAQARRAKTLQLAKEDPRGYLLKGQRVVLFGATFTGTLISSVILASGLIFPTLGVTLDGVVTIWGIITLTSLVFLEIMILASQGAILKEARRNPNVQSLQS